MSKRILKIITLVSIAGIMTNCFIHTNALEQEPEDGFIEEYEEEYNEEPTEDVHEHEFGDWYVNEEENLKIRECECGFKETEELENPTFVPEENAVVETETNIYKSVLQNSDDNYSNLNVLQETQNKKQEEKVLEDNTPEPQSTVILNTQFVNYDGYLTYNVYDQSGYKIAEKKITANSNITIKVPRNKFATITCNLSNSTKGVTQNVTKVSGTFKNESYYLNVVVTYVASCPHTDVREEKTEPTFKSSGVIKTICNNCGKTIRATAIPKYTCNHNNIEEIIIRQPTEQTVGTAKVVCKDCGKTIRIKDVDKSQHIHVFKTETEPATCSQTGYELNVCTNCGYVEVTKTIPQVEHSWDEGRTTKQPSCEVAGIIEYTCTKCGEKKIISKPALAHEFETQITKNATCKEQGIKTHTCKLCGKKVTENIPVTDVHNWGGEYTVTKNPTCTQKGESTLYCIDCGKVIDKIEIDTIPHNYEWVVTKEATNKVDGLKEYKCKVCGNVSATEVIPNTGCKHTSPGRKVQKIAPTCTQEEVVDIYCVDCGELIQSNVKYATDPNNHPNLKETILQPATYTEPGVKKISCPDCGYQKVQDIPKLVCNHTKTYIYLDQTTGKKYEKCDVCDKIIKEIVDPAITNCVHTGHGQDEVVITKADATHWGEYQYICKNCKKVLSTAKVHPYTSYTLQDQNGQTVTLYGWFDNNYAQDVFNQTNTYRASNGLNRLHYNTTTQDASNTRALEAAVYFSHTRPNGTKWNTVIDKWEFGGENIASGQTNPDKVMTAWKNSEGHNRNLLYGKESGQTPFKGLSVGCFHRFRFNNSTKPSVPTETIVWSQNFTFYEY